MASVSSIGTPALSNSAMVFANVTTKRLRTMTANPVHNWLGGTISHGNDGFRSPADRPNTDTNDEGTLQEVREQNLAGVESTESP